MASAQVLKKQEHLQAGKKKLEEFRKKRAAEKAKKTTSNSQQLASDGGIDNQHSGNEHTRTKDSSGAATSDAVGRSVLKPSEVHAKHDFAKPDLTQKSDLIFPSDASAGATPSLHKYYDDAVVKANSYDVGALLIYLILLQLYHLQLEEFSKKRAAEKAKRTTSNSQQLASGGGRC